MTDRSCIYCDDRGDCIRCSCFFEPEATHTKCGKQWKEHKIHTQDNYPPWTTCE